MLREREGELLPGVRLRPFEEADAAELYRLVDGDREDLARWMPWAAEQTLERTQDFLARACAQTDDEGLTSAITVDHRIAGVISRHGIERPRAATSLGYWLGSEFRGRGVMTAAVRAYTGLALGPWELNRVEILAQVDNIRSIAVAERVGYTREGVLREYLPFGETRRDGALYAMLAREWPAARDRA